MLIDKGAGEFNKHGNDSWAYDQRGFDYIMRDQFGYSKDLKDKLFVTKDRDKFQRIILKAAANDNFSFEDERYILGMHTCIIYHKLRIFVWMKDLLLSVLFT